MADENADIMLWTGDNDYLRPADFFSKHGVAYRYTHFRSVPELQRLLQSTIQLATWDDHDYGPNNANGSYPYKAWSKEVFDAFWPRYVSGAYRQEDVTSFYHYHGIDFFFLDNRTWREEPNDSAAMLTMGQIDWLIQNLKYSRSPFKVIAVGGQILNSLNKYENMAVYKDERDYLLRRIDEEGIEGVVFVTGDRHHTELSALTTPSGIEIYDFTCSPLSSRPKGDDYDEENNYRVEGTLVNTNNYGKLSFGGTFRERTLIIRVYDSEGNQLWMRELSR
jgi:alkaline phosphatase D